MLLQNEVTSITEGDNHNSKRMKGSVPGSWHESMKCVELPILKRLPSLRPPLNKGSYGSRQPASIRVSLVLLCAFSSYSGSRRDNWLPATTTHPLFFLRFSVHLILWEVKRGVWHPTIVCVCVSQQEKSAQNNHLKWRRARFALVSKREENWNQINQRFHLSEASNNSEISRKKRVQTNSVEVEESFALCRKKRRDLDNWLNQINQ